MEPLTGEPSGPPDSESLFISYSREHEALVGRLVKLLKLGTAEVFLDAQSIRPGERWEVKIETAIRSSRLVVVFWCCHSSASVWVHKELAVAYSISKPVAPVKLCSLAIPEEMSPYEWIDLTNAISHECNVHAGGMATGGSGSLFSKRRLPGTGSTATAIETRSETRHSGWERVRGTVPHLLSVICGISVFSAILFGLVWLLRLLYRWVEAQARGTFFEGFLNVMSGLLPYLSTMITLAAILWLIYDFFRLKYMHMEMGRSSDRRATPPGAMRNIDVLSRLADARIEGLAREIERRYHAS